MIEDSYRILDSDSHFFFISQLAKYVLITHFGTLHCSCLQCNKLQDL